MSAKASVDAAHASTRAAKASERSAHQVTKSARASQLSARAAASSSIAQGHMDEYGRCVKKDGWQGGSAGGSERRKTIDAGGFGGRGYGGGYGGYSGYGAGSGNGYGVERRVVSGYGRAW